MQKTGFSLETVRRANYMMREGIKPLYNISNKLSDEEIDSAWREAARKTFGEFKS